MYIDSLEFLDEERDAWKPFEALDGLSDEQLAVEQPDAHGWSGRDLMGHLLAWQEIALRVAQELAVSETSTTKGWTDREWAARGIGAMEHTLAKYAAFEEYLRDQADPESEDGDDRTDS